MAADPKTIRELDDIGRALAGTDLVEVQDQTLEVTKKSKLSSMLTYILGGKTVGGTGAGDIADIDSAQTFTNKTHISPKINENVALVPTSTKINATYALTANRALVSNANGEPAVSPVTSTELGCVAGATSPLQAQITALANQTLIGYNFLARQYNSDFTIGAGVTTKTITEADIATACGLGSYVVLTPVTIQLMKKDGDTFEEHAGHATKYTSVTDYGQVHLDEINISTLTASTTYSVSITFTIAARAGV